MLVVAQKGLIACTEARQSASSFPHTTKSSTSVPAIEDFLIPDVVDEVLVVDNNSRDRTAAEAVRPRARVVSETRQGYGYRASPRTAGGARGDIIILAEPDGTFIGRDVLKLLAYADDFDMVCGTRTTRELIWDQANMGWFLRVGNWAVAKLLQVLHGGPSLSDCGCTLRLTHRAAVERILGDLTVGGSHFLPEMVILALRKRLKVIEIPVNYRGRVGESKITGSFTGALRHRAADDRPHREVPPPMTGSASRNRAEPRRVRRAGRVPRRGRCRIVSTIDNYFVRDDFGVVELLCEQARRLLSAVVRVVMDGRDLGQRAGRSPAVSRRVVSADRTRRRRLAVSAPRAEHRAARRERPGGAGDCAAGCQAGAAGRDARRGESSSCCRYTARASPGSQAGSIRCRRSSTCGLLGVCALAGRRLAGRAPLLRARRSRCCSSRSSRSRRRSRWSRTLAAWDLLIARLAAAVLAVGAGLPAVRVDDRRRISALRLLLFGQVVRESTLNAEGLALLRAVCSSITSRMSSSAGSPRAAARVGGRGRVSRLVRRVAAAAVGLQKSDAALPRCCFSSGPSGGSSAWRLRQLPVTSRRATCTSRPRAGRSCSASSRIWRGCGARASGQRAASRCRGACRVRLLRCRAAAGRLANGTAWRRCLTRRCWTCERKRWRRRRARSHRRRADAQLGVGGAVFGAPAIHPRRFDRPARSSSRPGCCTAVAGSGSTTRAVSCTTGTPATRARLSSSCGGTRTRGRFRG